MKWGYKKNFVLLFLSMGIILGGCEKDLYNEPTKDPTPENNNSLFPEGSIPDDFDWSALATATLTVKVADAYEGKYLYEVEIFDDNPVTNKNATMLSKGRLKGDKSYTVELTFPKTLSRLYIRQIDPRKIKLVKSVAISSSQLTCDFASDPVVRSAVQDVSSRSSAVEDYPTPAGCIVVDNSQSSFRLSSGKTYLIAKGKPFKGDLIFPGEGNVSLYVEDELILTSTSITLQTGVKLIVQNGGKILTTHSKFKLKGVHNALLAVMEDGEFFNQTESPAEVDFTDQQNKIINKGVFKANKLKIPSGGSLYNSGILVVLESLEINSNSEIINEGSVTADDIDIPSNAVWYNRQGSMLLLDELTMKSSGSIIENEGKIVVEEIDLTNGQILNYCYIEVADEIKTNGGIIVLMPNSKLSTKELTAGGLKMTMKEASILEAEEVYFSTNASTITGNGNGFALLRLGKVAPRNGAVSGNNITYAGFLEMECASHTPNSNRWNPFYIDKGIQWADGKSTLEIPANPCNGEGNVVEQPINPPVDPEGPIIIPESNQIYTFAVEDNWPTYGDYDMNDFVMDIRYGEIFKDAVSNDILKMTLKVTLRATGATKQIGAGIQLDKVLRNKVTAMTATYNIDSDVSESISDWLDGSMFEVDNKNNPLENNQNFAVVAICDNVHNVLQPAENTRKTINTVSNSTSYPVRTATFTLSFGGQVSESDISIKMLNPFAITNDAAKRGKRKEIHLCGYQPTDKGDKNFYGQGNDNSTNTVPYKAKDNTIWSLLIPTLFQYPAENKKITDAYPDVFFNWATSGGMSNEDWYMRPSSDKGYIYE